MNDVGTVQIWAKKAIIHLASKAEPKEAIWEK